MTSLLVLGSKPEPALPPPDAYDAVACANASGRSAAHYGLPQPVHTVMSAILTSGRTAANDLALEALPGLATGTLYFYPRPTRGANAVARAWHRLRTWRMQPGPFRRRIDALGYCYERFVARELADYLDIVTQLCGHDPEIAACIEAKLPSSGIMSLALGIAEGAYARYILAGFSFEISHAYAANPLIGESGTSSSKHADTDIAVLRCLARRHGNIVTTEPVVHERAGLPLLDGSLAAR